MSQKRYVVAIIGIGAVLLCGWISSSALAQETRSSHPTMPDTTIELNATTLPGMARELTQARIAADQAWAGVLEARDALWQAQAESENQAQSSPQLEDARKQQKDALQSYRLTRQQILDQLRQDPKYQTLTATAKEIGAKIDKVREQGENEGVVRGLAEAKLSYSKQASQMEREAFDANPAMKEAETRLKQTYQQLQSARQQAQEAAKDSPAIAQARRQLDEAQANFDMALEVLTVAEAAWNTAIADRHFYADLVQRFGFGGWGLFPPAGW